jgi:hypothetical protein
MLRPPLVACWLRHRVALSFYSMVSAAIIYLALLVHTQRYMYKLFGCCLPYQKTRKVLDVFESFLPTGVDLLCTLLAFPVIRSFSLYTHRLPSQYYFAILHQHSFRRETHSRRHYGRPT